MSCLSLRSARNAVVAPTQHAARTEVKRPRQVLDLYEPPRSLAGGLHDSPEAVDIDGCVARVKELWHSQLRGQHVKREQLSTFTKVSHNNQVKLLIDREYFHTLLPALAAATDSIHVALLTFDDSPIGNAIADLLIAKKKANPQMQIRIIYDGWGSKALMPVSNHVSHLRRMQGAGIDVICNNVFEKGLEHRKLVVIDGKIGFFGGTCFGKEYYGSKAYWAQYNKLASRVGTDVAKRLFVAKYDSSQSVPQEFAALDALADMPEYHDYGMQVNGDTVRGLQAAFLQSWLLHRGVLELGLTPSRLETRYFPKSESPGNTVMKINNSVPGGASEMGESLSEAVHAAKHTLDVTFAYILVPHFVDTLEQAARRGVKIRILVPGEKGIDLPAAFYAFRYQYPKLFATGNVDIFEFKQYTHIKLMVADHRVIFASTGNPEWDSWQRAFDETAIIDDAALARSIDERVFAVDYGPEWSTHVTPEVYGRMTFFERCRMLVSRFLFDTFFRARRAREAAVSLNQSTPR